jgi:hypothetical protein
VIIQAKLIGIGAVNHKCILQHPEVRYTAYICVKAIIIKLNVKVTLKQAIKAQRGNEGTALPCL